MTSVRALLKDRKRSQRGSVLSGVLIITAFIAIISGALMTELSTNLILSRNLINRVNNEATDSSAVEVTLSQLQATALNAPCPAPIPANVNSSTASASYLGCWPTVLESQKVATIAGSGSPFLVDGTLATANGLDDYVVGDAGGNLYDTRFGSYAPRWSIDVGSSVTGTPLVIPMPGSSTQVLDVVPVEGRQCAGVENCLNVQLDTAGAFSPPTAECVAQATSGTIQAQPGSSATQAGLVYFATGPTLVATSVLQSAQQQCSVESSVTIPNNELLQGQPIAMACTKGCGSASEFVYTLVGSGAATHLLEWTFGKSSLKLARSFALPWGGASGWASSGGGSTVSVAISFSNGALTIAQLTSTGTVSIAPGVLTGSAIGDAPYWCHCPGGDLIGVGGQNGALSLYNTALQLVAASPAGGSAIGTTPAADAAGDWYFGADDGLVHEDQQVPGQPSLSQVDAFGQMGRTTSTVIVSGCSIGICAYLGAADNHAYLVPLDARRAIISACVSTAPPTCSGVNPRLWAKVVVGGAGSPQAVAVEGWSYYSG